MVRSCNWQLHALQDNSSAAALALALALHIVLTASRPVRSAGSSGPCTLRTLHPAEQPRWRWRRLRDGSDGPGEKRLVTCGYLLD
eukprot:scaffold12967_cov120-Isochrysis_galbana.AAC.6